MPKNSWERDRKEKRDSETDDRLVIDHWGDGSTDVHRYTDEGAFVNSTRTTSNGDNSVSHDLMNDCWESSDD